MNIFKLQTIDYRFTRYGKWKRKLRLLDALRPRLIRSEYVIRLEEKGYKLKNIKVVYNVIDEYIALDKFSMYPQDNINSYYLREKKDLELLIEKIFLKLKICKKQDGIKTLNNLTEPLTVMTILDIINENSQYLN